MKYFFGFFIMTLLFCQLSYGQNRKLSDLEYNRSTAAKIVFADTSRNCDVVDSWFKDDIEKGVIFLFLKGGISPVTYHGDAEFENKYRIYFAELGCTSPDYNCMVRYNRNVFNYLTSLYGRKWLKTVRKDVVGLKNWKPAMMIGNPEQIATH